MFFVESEGFNGNYHSDELERIGEEGEVLGSYYRRYRPQGVYKSPKKVQKDSKDPLYYHVPLFAEGETYKVVRETEKAFLYEVQDGKFWVPKALIKNGMVYKAFERKYI